MANKSLTIAEALVLRKHLAEKVEQLRPIKVNGDNGMFELQTKRTKVTDEVDEITLQVPKVEMANITKEFDTYSKALRELDTAIQKANWENTVGFTVPTGVNV